MIAFAKSKYEVVENLSDIPILGGFLVIVFSALPGMFLAIYSSWFSEISENHFQLYTGVSFVIWNVYLWKREIKIYILFIPAWTIWLLIGIYKLYEYFNLSLL